MDPLDTLRCKVHLAQEPYIVRHAQEPPMESVSTRELPLPSELAAISPLPMRAILQSRYGSADSLRVGTTERPRPGAGEVLVEVRAAGIDRGTWHLMTGRPYLIRLMGFGYFGPNNPV